MVPVHIPQGDFIPETGIIQHVGAGGAGGGVEWQRDDAVLGMREVFRPGSPGRPPTRMEQGTARLEARELREELRANEELIMQCNTVRAPHTTPHHTTLEQPFAHPQARVSPLALALARPNYVSRRNAAR